MSLTAAAIRLLAKKGLSIDDIAEIAEANEQVRPTTFAGRALPSIDDVKVYVIEELGGLVKVGISQHPGFRLTQLQSERIGELNLCFVSQGFARTAALAIERGAHSRLHQHRRHGEWFACSSAEAAAAVREELECQ